MYKSVPKMNKNIMSKGREKILQCFYKNRNKELYFSEILRETSLTQNTTLKHLKFLKENQIILSHKKIANTFYKLNNKNPKTFSLLSYLDNQKFNNLPSIRKRALTEFLDKIETKPIIAVVFGSTAKGTFTKESDIDLLLIFNRKELKHKKIKKRHRGYKWL